MPFAGHNYKQLHSVNSCKLFTNLAMLIESLTLFQIYLKPNNKSFFSAWLRIDAVIVICKCLELFIISDIYIV